MRSITRAAFGSTLLLAASSASCGGGGAADAGGDAAIEASMDASGSDAESTESGARDATGGDAVADTFVPTPGNDVDWDGYPAGLDCDDTNDRVYPGISTACTAACGAGTHTCNPDGTFTACDCTPRCEATAGGHCYYVSAASGSDSNPGTFQSPWRTYLPVAYYYADQVPPGHVDLAPGDVVYFRAGTYSDTYACCGQATADEALLLRDTHGAAGAPITLKAYPGESVVFAPRGTNGVHFLQSSHLRVEGIEIRGGFGFGVYVEESDDVELRNLSVHDMDGNAGDNAGTGVHLLSSTQVELHHSTLFDNYPRAQAPDATDHKQQVIAFRGGNVHVHHNVFYQSAGIANAGVLYKHRSADAAAVFEVDHNVFRGLSVFSVGSGTQHTHIHHNHVIDSGPFTFMDFGGPTQNSDVVMEFNTLHGGSAVSYDPSLGPNTDDGPVGPLTFRNNIVVDPTASYGSGGGVVAVGTYLDDATYDAVVRGGLLAFGPNCYFNPATALVFDLFTANGGAYGTEGASFDFASWQGAGYDTASVVGDPQLDANDQPRASACAGFGYLAP